MTRILAAVAVVALCAAPACDKKSDNTGKKVEPAADKTPAKADGPATDDKKPADQAAEDDKKPAAGDKVAAEDKKPAAGDKVGAEDKKAVAEDKKPDEDDKTTEDDEEADDEEGPEADEDEAAEDDKGEWDPIAALDKGFALFNEGKLEASAAAFADDCVWTRYGDPAGPAKGPAGIAKRMGEMKTAFPDGKVAPRRIFTSEGMVAVELVFTGTHKGQLAGMPPATNKPVGTSSLHLIWYEDGKFSRWDEYADMMTAMRQIGAIPEDVAGPAPPVQTLPDKPEIISGAGDAKHVELIKKLQTLTDPAAAAELVHADIVGHSPMGDMKGLEAMGKMMQMWMTAFPDAKGTASTAVAVGDYVISAWNWKGTHKGEFMGTPATGKAIDTHTADISRIEGGKLKESWNFYNSMELGMQLGLMGGEPKK